MINNLRPYQEVFYFGEPCTVVEVYGDKYVLQVNADTSITHTVNKTSRFIEVSNSIRKYLQHTELVKR